MISCTFGFAVEPGLQRFNPLKSDQNLESRPCFQSSFPRQTFANSTRLAGFGRKVTFALENYGEGQGKQQNHQNDIEKFELRKNCRNDNCGCFRDFELLTDGYQSQNVKSIQQQPFLS